MRRIRWSRLLLCGLGTGAAYVLLVSLLLHPFWAVTRPSGGRALVVEGWMHEAGLERAAALFRDGGYARVAVTGARRPFAYYLRPGDTIEVAFDGPRAGLLEASIAGLPGQGWRIVAHDSMVLRGAADEGIRRHAAAVRATERLRIIAEGRPDADAAPALFIAGLRLAGASAHQEGAGVVERLADGRQRPGTPTYAHHGARALARHGVPGAAIAVLPTWRIERSKTFSAARDAARWAREQGIAAYDVATLAVHARRTWKMHRIAHGGDSGVGIIALDDPWCRRWSWWGNYYGWYQVLKETAALPAPWLVDRLNGDEGEEPTAPGPR